MPIQEYDLTGQTVLITGASSGIGEACAWRFAEHGCKLILVARRLERLVGLRDGIAQKHAVPIHIVQMDLMKISEVEQLPSTLPEQFSQVDILVNNAGLALGVAPVHENSLEDARVMFETNVMAVIALCRVFTPAMVERNKGHIVMISSIAAHESYAGGSMYCASKHALDGFTVGVRHDLVGTKIRVTAISPGAVKTEFGVVRFKGDVAKADAVYQGFTPLSGDDIADNVIYACTRPLHVQIAEVVVFANHQSSAKGLARVET